MSQKLEQLVHDVIDLTGADRPLLFEDDAPVLGGEALRSGDEMRLEIGDVVDAPKPPAEGVYLIGLIGGKEVGKSALVNALAGRTITESTSFGEGTQIVTAYAHVQQSGYLRELLTREVPGKFRIVTHDSPRLARQVLLDLPDIDSHWQEHVEVTRRMLRHMLFPLWIQSVEKYADMQPQQLLLKVASGNAAQNFVFCLNKVDQLMKAAPDAAREVRDDYGKRLGRALNLGGPARVFMVSAIQPDRFDLPALRELLGTQKSVEEVELGRLAAARQQEATIFGWIQRQNLPERSRRLERLGEEAEDTVHDRLAIPLLERAVPAILDDPAHRLSILDECLKQRCARWPFVNIVQALAGPIASVFRRRLSAEQQRTLEGPDVLVETYLRPEGRDLSASIQTTFAYLQQSQPLISHLYKDRKLWEARPADLATGELQRALADTVTRQRAMIVRRACGRSGLIGHFLRGFLTIGALLWFPLIQPMVEAMLQDNFIGNIRHILLIVARAFSVASLLQTVSFLILWYFIIWLIVRWNTQRRIERQLARWKSTDSTDPELNLAVRTMEWVETLTQPIRLAREKIDRLIERSEELRGDMEKAA